MSMSMPRPGAPPLSPMSMSSGDSGVVGRYGSMGGGPGIGPGTPNDVPYAGGPYNAARPPQQASPPSSGHPSSATDMSRPSASGSSNRPPSSTSSVGMSSNSGRPSNMRRDSNKSQMRPEGEDALQRHYMALKAYLASQLADEKGNIKPNRARDKLLRLSVTQFMELSTDVYDELIRREDERTHRVDNVPRFLLPKQNFHPKRNQARQKLSTLPIERFRQLATDVFFELERRIPRIAGGAIDRPMSANSNGSRAPSRGGMRPPGPYGPGPGFPPGGPGSRPRMGPNGSYGGQYGPMSPGLPPGSRRPSEAGSQLGRPLPKTFQTNTILPNKSTMVEDDDPEEEDGFGIDHHFEEDKAKIEAQETEISELKEKLEDLEAKLSEQGNKDIQDERGEWASLREDLEQQARDAQSLNENLRKEIDQLRQSSSERLREEISDLQDQVDSHEAANRDLRARIDDHQIEKERLERQLQEHQGSVGGSESERRIEMLEEELAKQEAMMNEVRQEATLYLQEMRDLSRQTDQAIEQEERLSTRVSQLEKENSDWRQRYAKIKAQNRSLRASTMGLGMQHGFDAGSLVRQEGLISEGGLVRDTDVTRFQLAVDELLQSARGASTSHMLESVKSVVVSVQSMTSAVGTDGYPTPSPSPLGPDTNMHPPPSVAKLKARVTGTANSLITATKQHAAAHGLSPVALLDAAASNLTSAVVQLIKAVHIRPSSNNELRDIDAVDELESFYNDGLSPNETSSPPPLPGKDVKTPTTAPGAKKANNWFAWGKWSDGEEEHPGQANGQAQHQHSQSHASAHSDYDAYT